MKRVVCTKSDIYMYVVMSIMMVIHETRRARMTFDIYVLFVNGVPTISDVAATHAKLKKNETNPVKSGGLSSGEIVLRMSFGIIYMIPYLHL